MRVFTVAERELRAAARHKGLYRLRWIAAALAFGFLLWLAWVEDVFQNKGVAPEVFRIFARAILVYGLFVGATATADCLSRERRDGTLGLLFLTNLNSLEIVVGKLAAHGLALFYSLLAIFPMLALPVMMGGISPTEFLHTILALLGSLGLAMAIGFAASSVCVRQFPAVALACGVALAWGLGLMLLVEGLRELKVPRATTDWVATFCPLQTLFAAEAPRRVTGPAGFWFSLSMISASGLALLLAVAGRLGRTWRDRPKRVWRWAQFRWRDRVRQRGSIRRVSFRRRLLNLNPFFWLGSRQRVSAPVFMLVAFVVTLGTSLVAAPNFARMLGGSTASPVFGQMFAWFWAGLITHALVLYYAAHAASQRVAEDKQAGALELVLCVPATERMMTRGHWLAFARRMFFPVLFATLVHLFFIWALLNMILLDPPGQLPRGVTQSEVFWCSLLGLPLKGRFLDWEFGMMIRAIVLAWLILAANWVMLGWAGRWLGLRMKHPGFAPMLAVALTVAPPVLLFSLLCFVMEESGAFRLPDRQIIPLMLWVAAGIALGNCLLLAVWAATRLRHDFRRMVTSRYEPSLPGEWWRTTRRLLLRFTTAIGVLLLALGLAIASFYGYQTWRSKQNWAQFQSQLQQRGETLGLAGYLPAPVPEAENLAHSPAIRFATQGTNRIGALLREAGRHAAIDPNPGAALGLQAEWRQQRFAPLDFAAGWMDPKKTGGTTLSRTQHAVVIWERLQPIEAELAAVAAAARVPSFRPSGERTARAVLDSDLPPLKDLVVIHYLLQQRALAALELNRASEAAADVLTGLRLADLMRQSPDILSTRRVQVLLMRSLQPTWEGLARSRWTEAQLLPMQSVLERFDLLADHTNALGRVVRAYAEVWSAIPDSKSSGRSVFAGNGTYISRREWAWQPRTWWYDHSIQLFAAGRTAIGRVDFATHRVDSIYNWSDLSGLPLEYPATMLFQQNAWWGNHDVNLSSAQTALQQAIIACALERHRLAQGSFPRDLNELVPDYLKTVPRDPATGRPMFYDPPNGTNSYELRGAGYDGSIQARAPVSDDLVWAFISPTNNPPKPKPQPVRR